jgi:hypothetical protein
MISIIRNIAPGLSSSVKSVVSVSAYSLFRVLSSVIIADHFLVIHEPVVRRAFLFLVGCVVRLSGIAARLDGKKYRSVARMIFFLSTCPQGCLAHSVRQTAIFAARNGNAEFVLLFPHFPLVFFGFPLQPSFCLLYIFFFYFELGDSLLEHFVRLFVKKEVVLLLPCGVFPYPPFHPGDLCLGCCQRGEAGAE